MNMVAGARERGVTIIRVGNGERWQTHLQELFRQLAQLPVGCVLHRIFILRLFVCLFVGFSYLSEFTMLSVSAHKINSTFRTLKTIKITNRMHYID